MLDSGTLEGCALEGRVALDSGTLALLLEGPATLDVRGAVEGRAASLRDCLGMFGCEGATCGRVEEDRC